MKKHTEVFLMRIRRGMCPFCVNKLGAWVDLVALSAFFDPLWSKPVDGLNEDIRTFLCNEAGFGLLALGWLPEAAR